MLKKSLSPAPPLAAALLVLSLLALPALPAAADGPGVLKFDESSFEYPESAGVATIVVERSKGEDGAVSVSYSTSDGTATAGTDYVPASGTLNWGPNDGSNKTFTITILADGATEAAETVNLTLSNPTGGATIDSEDGTSVLVILGSGGGGGGGGDDGPGDDNGGGGDDGPGDDNGGGGDGGPGDDNGGDDDGDGKVGIFKFDQRDFFAVESSRTAVISVERSKGETGAASVEYRTVAGTATAGADFTPTSGTFQWGPGDESNRTFTIDIRNDGIEEGPETVMLELFNPSAGAGLDNERAHAVLTVLDDDQGQGTPEDSNTPGVLKFDERSFEVFEGSGGATIRVERSKGEGGSVSVRYTASDGSAEDGLDFTATTGVLSWGNGDGSVKTFTVPVLDDGLTEGNESVRLVLSEATGGATLDAERGSSTLRILDDDGSTVACSDDSNTLCFLNGRFQVEVGWRNPQGQVGQGTMIKDSDRSGRAWFFSDTNIELLVKMLDACDPFGSFWVFYGATTNVDFTLTVTDTQTGQVKQYTNPLGQAAEPVQDTATFQGCP